MNGKRAVAHVYFGKSQTIIYKHWLMVPHIEAPLGGSSFKSLEFKSSKADKDHVELLFYFKSLQLHVSQPGIPVPVTLCGSYIPRHTFC